MNSQNDNPLRILSAVDLYNINEEVTDHPAMIRDHQVLQSAVRRPYIILFGQEQFPTLLEKAAATMYSVAAHHVFVDGNKRTAVRATQLFLEANGMRTTWSDDDARKVTLRIAKGNFNIEQITEWLTNNTEPIPSDD